MVVEEGSKRVRLSRRSSLIVLIMVVVPLFSFLARDQLAHMMVRLTTLVSPQAHITSSAPSLTILAPSTAEIASSMQGVLVTDLDGDGQADPGDVVLYTVLITNTGDTDATGMVFSDTLPANTSLVADSVQSTPLAYDQSLSTNADTPLAITLTAMDADGDVLTFSITTNPAHGTLSGTAPNLTYTADPGFEGDDSLVFQVCDTNTPVACNSATIAIRVHIDNHAPVAVDDFATVVEDATATTVDVLANDTDPENDAFSIDTVTQPVHGVVAITNGGADLTYTPNANYCNDPPGTTLDTFIYTLTPGGDSATVTITVTCVDDAPTVVDDTLTVSEDAGDTTLDVLANDVDLENDVFTIDSVTQPANGSVAITSGGAGLTYTPNANYCNDPPGTTLDTFTYTLTPGGSEATVSVTVTCVDDPPVAVDDSATVDEDAGASAVDVLANDTDVDAGPISITSVTQPANGTVAITGGGTGLTYQPNPNYCNNPPGAALDTFTYTLTPGGNTATVSVTVICVDDLPVAVNDAATVGEDSGANAIDVQANDTDIDAGPISITAVTQPINGVVVITGGGTGMTYTPNANFCNDPPGTTPDTFTYMLNGGSVGTVAVTVTCVNDPPVAVDQGPFEITGNIQRTFGTGTLLSGASDPDGTTLTTELVGTPTNNADVVVNGDGSFSYNPGAGYDGTAIFQYRVCDDGDPLPSLCSTAKTVTLNITGMIWFIDNAATAGGNGRLTNPFNTLAAFESINNGTDNNPAAGDNIFLYTGNANYTGGVTLLANQRLIGQGATASLSTITGLTPPPGSMALPSTGGTPPVIVDSGGDAVTLGSGNSVRGLNVGDASGFAFRNNGTNSVGNLTISEVSVNNTTGGGVSIGNGGTLAVTFANLSSNGGTNGVNLVNVGGLFAANAGNLVNAAGVDFNITGGTANVTFNGAINDDVGTLVAISGTTGGTKDFNGAISGGGISLTNNIGATIRFDGGLTLTTGDNPAFTATGGGTVVVTDPEGAATNTLATTTGTALNVANTTIGADGLTFMSISANGAENGIILDSTGSLGGLTVTGTASGSDRCGGTVTNTSSPGTLATVTEPVPAECTGGTIQNTTGEGIVLNNVTNVLLSRMQVRNYGADGITVNNINGFTLNNSLVIDNSTANPNDDGVVFGNFTTGTAVNGLISFTNSTITMSAHNNLAVGIGSGISIWSITGSTFSFAGGNDGGGGTYARSGGNSGITFEIRNTASVQNFIMMGNAVMGNYAAGIQIAPATDSTGFLAAVIQNNSFNNNTIAMDLNALAAADMLYTVQGNTIENVNRRAATLGADSTSHAVNIFQGSPSSGVLILRFTGNSIGDSTLAGSGSSVGNGIRLNFNNNGQGHVLIDGNTIREAPQGRGIEVIGRNGTGQLDITITNNNVDHVNTNFSPGVSEYELAAIFIQSNVAGTSGYTVRSDVRGNTVPVGVPDGELLSTYIALLEAGASNLQLVDNPPGPPGQTPTQQLQTSNTGSASADAGVSLIDGPINTPS